MKTKIVKFALWIIYSKFNDEERSIKEVIKE